MQKILLDSSTSLLNSDYINSIYDFLELIDDEYPNFKSWYFNKVFNNIQLVDRKLLIYKWYNEICAVAILKPSEKKVCTLRVTEKFHGNNIGSTIMEESLNILNTRRPLITVSENRMQQFENIFSKFDFVLHSIRNNYYNNGKSEFIFNHNMIENKTYSDPFSHFDKKEIDFASHCFNHFMETDNIEKSIL